MIRATIAAAFCAGLAAGGCGSAFAEDCAGNVFSHETFDAQPSGWTSNPQVKVEDGRLQMMPNAGQSLSIPVAVPDQGAFEACVTANLAAGSGGQVSFVVSMPRHNSEVFFTLDSKGTVNIRRHDTATGKWTSVDEAGGDPAVKTGIGGTNRLRVEIDEFATLYVNDSPLPLASALDEVAGAPLQLRLQIDADKRGPSIWLIDDVVISTADATAGATASTAISPPASTAVSPLPAASSPPAASPSPAAVTADCSGDPIFQENFDHPPADWKPTPEFDAVDGKLQIDVPSGGVVALPINVRDAKEYDVCLTTRLVSGAGKYVSLDLSAGASDPLLVFSVNSDGTGDIFRYDRASKQWTPVVATKRFSAIKAGTGGENRLRLAIGARVLTLYLNDREFGSIANPFGASQTSIKLQAVSASGGASTWTVDDLLVATPADAGDQTLPLSIDQLITYKSLANASLGLKGFSVTRHSGDPHPPSGLAQLTVALAGTDSDATGQAIFRFYGSSEDAAAYLGDGKHSPFLDEIKSTWSGPLQTGQIEDGEDTVYLAASVDPAGYERVWAGSRVDEVVTLGSFVVPRPGVQPTDSVRQQTLRDAAANVYQLYGDLLEAELAHPTGAGSGMSRAGSGASGESGGTSGGSSNGGDTSVADAGCQGTPLYQTGFDDVPPRWKTNDPSFSVEGGKLLLRSKPGAYIWNNWSVGDIRSFDACVTAALVDGPGRYVALSVQQTDTSTRTLFAVWSDGSADIEHEEMPAKTWTNLIPSKDNVVSGFGGGAEVRLHVKVRGGDATFYVNGRQIAFVAGAVPSGELNVRVEGGATEDGIATWSFDDLVVTNGTDHADPAAAAGCQGEVLAKESFDGRTPAPWASLPDTDYSHVGVADGHFVMAADDSRGSAYVEAKVGDGQQTAVEYCASVVRESGPVRFGGLTVKGANSRYRLVFAVGSGNTADVYRFNVRSGGSSAVLRTREVKSIRQDAGAVNYLRIEVNGRDLSFFVNGELFGSTSRNVTDGGLLIGLQVATFGPDPGVWYFDDVTATTLNPSASQ